MREVAPAAVRPTLDLGTAGGGGTAASAAAGRGAVPSTGTLRWCGGRWRSARRTAGALELVYTLAQRGDGHAYFDTLEPTRRGQHNAALALLKRALERGGMGALLEAHDAMGALELIESLEA